MTYDCNAVIAVHPCILLSSDCSDTRYLRNRSSNRPSLWHASPFSHTRSHELHPDSSLVVNLSQQMCTVTLCSHASHALVLARLSAQIYKVDLKRDLLYVIGSVPGTKGAYVRVKDCQKLFSRKREKGMPLPPFPTAPTSVGDVLARYKGKSSKLEWVMDAQEHDPFGMHDWDEPEPV